MNIEIGGGTLVQPGWANMDKRNGSPGLQRDAADTPWPLPDDSVDHIRASHVLEHIRAEDRINIFNEAHRVLRPGGIFEVILPLLITENGLPTWHAIADPTHVSYWCRESFYYFTARPGTTGQVWSDAIFAANADYGIKLWHELNWFYNQGFEGNWTATPA